MFYLYLVLGIECETHTDSATSINVKNKQNKSIECNAENRNF